MIKYIIFRYSIFFIFLLNINLYDENHEMQFICEESSIEEYNTEDCESEIRYLKYECGLIQESDQFSISKIHWKTALLAKQKYLYLYFVKINNKSPPLS